MPVTSVSMLHQGIAGCALTRAQTIELLFARDLPIFAREISMSLGCFCSRKLPQTHTRIHGPRLPASL